MVYVPDIRQIRIFIALEETRSFTSAAEKLNITQSAVSHSIKSLESSLNCTLVERLGKKCILSPHGEVFLHHAQQAMNQLEAATLKIKTLNQWGYNSLKVGASDTLCQHVFPQALAEFYKENTKTEVFMTPADTPTLIKELQKGELDIAFGIKKNTLEMDNHFTPIGEDKLCFITSPEHVWCDRAPENVEDFESERFITYGNSSVTQYILNAHLSGIGIKQRATLVMNNMESIKEMAALNLGVGIVAEWMISKEIKAGTLVKHDITPAPTRQWGYYKSKSKSLSLSEELFIKAFSSQLLKTIG